MSEHQLKAKKAPKRHFPSFSWTEASRPICSRLELPRAYPLATRQRMDEKSTELYLYTKNSFSSWYPIKGSRIM